MVHLSVWPVTQAARRGTSADGRYSEVPKCPGRALWGEGHRWECYVTENGNESCGAGVSWARQWQCGARSCDTDLWVRHTSGPRIRTAVHTHTGCRCTHTRPYQYLYCRSVTVRGQTTVMRPAVAEKERNAVNGRSQHLAHDLGLNQTWGFNKSAPWHLKSPPAGLSSPQVPTKRSSRVPAYFDSH